MTVSQSSTAPPQVALPIRKSAARRAAEARGFDPIAHARQRVLIAREQRESIASQSPDAFKDFARQVALATSGTVLRYSHRLHLLDLAQRGGINRFDANLIIAAIENRAVKSRPITAKRSNAGACDTSSSIGGGLLWSAIAVQIMIFVGAWMMLLR